MDTEKRHMIIPMKREKDGSFLGILSDDSVDRDNELMSPDLIDTWAMGDALPFLSDHSNEMDELLGAWTERKIVEQDGHRALVMKPNFFSAEANPKAQPARCIGNNQVGWQVHPAASHMPGRFRVSSGKAGQPGHR